MSKTSPTWLIDKSAYARLGMGRDDQAWADRIDPGAGPHQHRHPPRARLLGPYSRGLVPLFGRTTTSPWDVDLAPTMADAGVAVYEEQVLDQLLDDLARHAAAPSADGGP